MALTSQLFLARLAVLSSQFNESTLCQYSSSSSPFPSSSCSASTERRPVAVVFGAGDGIGQACARKFAHEGFTVCIVRRDRHADRLKEQAEQLTEETRGHGGPVIALAGDARLEEDVIRIVSEAESHGPITIALHNIGANVPAATAETSTRLFTKVWEMACLSGFLVGRECAKVMLPRGQGSLLFSGATASVRGASGFAAFSSAKGGLRMVTQSLAREFGPAGLHVAHLVIDGPVDSPFIKENMQAFGITSDRLITPKSIADTFYFLHTQPRDAWTFEMDLRAKTEPW